MYPGSFDPPTIAHIHVARCAIEQLGLDRVDFVISSVTLGKDDANLTPIADRVSELEAIIGTDNSLGVRISPDSLLATIAYGYDAVIVGADKWHQILDPVWYGTIEDRDRTMTRLPLVALAPRPPWTMPGEDAAAEPPAGVEFFVLNTDPSHHPVSATAVRNGRHEWRALRTDNT